MLLHAVLACCLAGAGAAEQGLDDESFTPAVSGFKNSFIL